MHDHTMHDHTMIPLPSPDAASFGEFARRLSSPDLVATIAADAGWDHDTLSERISIALGEVRQTLRILYGVALSPGARLLEVGAGLGLTSAYLSTCGFDVTALEPAGLGFAEHASIATSIAAATGSQHKLLSIGAAELDEPEHGRYDLIFSNNVLEHIDDPVAALRSMREVMAVDGLMVHSCPNYTVPFEPHFGIPLVPGRPAWTARILPGSIASSTVWRSLNFITARRLRRWADDFGLATDFRSGALATSVERLGSDPEFRARHRVLAVVGRALVAARITALLRRLPASLSTPMDFVLSTEATDRGRVDSWLSALDQF